MSDEVWDTYKVLRKIRQEKRAQNRVASAEQLTGNRIPFEVKNGGAHLIVQSANGSIDFWPGTGLWRSGCGKSGRGIKNLLRFLRTTENVAKSSRIF